MASSEDVLLPVSNVKFKKNDGTLYLMAERIGWIIDGKDTFSITHKYADIKMQKISPDGKAKVQLQIVLHDGESSTFHFVNPMGSDAQKQDRDSVKEILLQMLPKFKRKVNKELEEKNRRLAEDPELFQLYKDLVMTQVTTAEDFWATYAVDKKNGGQKQQPNFQEVGVSGAFLAGIKPEVDGSTGLKYNLTTDTIESIFRTYPAVKKKHLENVPMLMDETEFWKQFFQSHYFHRDRLSIGTKDLFTECAKSDEQDVKKMISQVVNDPLLDLNQFDDAALDEGYGHSKPATQGHQANLNLIKRFNHHSMMVLKACEAKGAAVSGTCVIAPNSKEAVNGDKATRINGKNSPVINGYLNHMEPSCSGSGDHATSESKSKKARLKEKVTYDDLNEEEHQKTAGLNLAMTDRYLHGPAVLQVADYPTDDKLCAALERVSDELGAWRPELTQVLSSTTALSVLSELSPGGALMKNSQINNSNVAVPPDLQQELKHHYNALCELLRHFWSCFPVTTPFLEEKVLKIRGCIERFEYAKLAPFQEKLQRDHHYDRNVTAHLGDLIDAAYKKFNNWQARKASNTFRR